MRDHVADRLAPDQFVLAWPTDQADLPGRFNGALAKPITMDALVECGTRRCTGSGLSAPLSAQRAA